MAKSEKDWNIGFAKCITSVSGAEVAENHDRALDQFGRGSDPEPSVSISGTILRSRSRAWSAAVAGSGPHTASTIPKRACICQ